MPSLIPHLKDLCYIKNRFDVRPAFAEGFVKIHQISERVDGPWRTAQEHWERVVERVLETDAVAHDADGDEAICQAVVAAAELLGQFLDRGRCPVCPTRTPQPRHQRDERERV